MKKTYEQPDAEQIRLTAMGVITANAPELEEDEFSPLRFGLDP